MPRILPSGIAAIVTATCSAARAGDKNCISTRHRNGRAAASALALAVMVAAGPAFESRAVECSNGGVGASPAGNDGGRDSNTACGENADASGGLSSRNTALGLQANASGDGSRNLAIGSLPEASGNISANTAIGRQAVATGETSQNLALGDSANAAGDSSSNTAIGARARARGLRSIAIGSDAHANWDSDANAPSGFAVAIAIGSNATAPANNAIALGTNSEATGALAMALGRGAIASRPRSVAIGNNSVADAADTISVGSKGNERRIVNVATAIKATDAVNLGQVQAMLSAAAVAAKGRAASSISHAAPVASAALTASRSDRRAGGGRHGALNAASISGDKKRSNAGSTARPSEELAPSTIVGWANVKDDGTLSRFRNVTGSRRHGTGQYEIAFARRSLGRCTFNAALSGIGFVSVKLGPLANSLRVETRDHRGALSDAAFRLMAVC